MGKLKPCPFCGGKAHLDSYMCEYIVICTNPSCRAKSNFFPLKIEAQEAWNNRTETKIETNIFDVEEVHENCTVQILKNTVTGEESVGWWENE